MSRINLLILSFVIYYSNILINIKACINFFILDVDVDNATRPLRVLIFSLGISIRI